MARIVSRLGSVLLSGSLSVIVAGLVSGSLVPVTVQVTVCNSG